MASVIGIIACLSLVIGAVNSGMAGASLAAIYGPSGLNRRVDDLNLIAGPTGPTGGFAPTHSTAIAPVIVSSSGGITFASVVPGSTDVSGSIAGTTDNSVGLGIMTLAFGTNYSVIPKAVILTPTSATTWNGLSISLNSLTTGVFTIRGTPTGTVTVSTPLLYYLVVA